MRRMLSALLLLAALLWGAPARAAAIPAEIATAFLNQGLPAERLTVAYEALLQGIGNGLSLVSGRIWANAATSAEVGEILIDDPRMMRHALAAIRTAGGALARGGAAESVRVLSAGSAHAPAIRAAFNPSFISAYAEAAARAAGQGGARQVTALAIAEASAAAASPGWGARFTAFLGRIVGRLGTFLGWLTTTTAQRILGVHAIASFTQSQIDEALVAFEEEMEAIGDAAEAEAYNANLGLLLDRLRDGRLQLRPGMTLAEAIRGLRRSMASGGSIFGPLVALPAASDFAVVGVQGPSVIISNAPRQDVTVHYSGTPAFPVTVIARPARTPCVNPVPREGWTCFTETRPFARAPADGRLVMTGAAWCAGAPRGSWTTFYEIVLRDSRGRESAPLPTSGTCVAR